MLYYSEHFPYLSNEGIALSFLESFTECFMTLKSSHISMKRPDWVPA